MKHAIVTSDWHPDYNTAGLSRFEDVAAAVKECVDYTENLALRVGPENVVWFFVGDLCNPDSGSVVVKCIRLMMNTAFRLKKAGVRQVWIAGNHDPIEDGSGHTTLWPLKNLSPFIQVFEQPELCRLRNAEEDYILALPFTARSHTYDPAEFVREQCEGKMMRNLVVLSHLTVPDAQLDNESKELARGRDMHYPSDALRQVNATHMHLYQGHYHRAQEINTSCGVVHVCGSIQQLTFGKSPLKPSFIHTTIGL